jgi:hypothetical protein
LFKTFWGLNMLANSCQPAISLLKRTSLKLKLPIINTLNSQFKRTFITSTPFNIHLNHIEI